MRTDSPEYLDDQREQAGIYEGVVAEVFESLEVVQQVAVIRRLASPEQIEHFARDNEMPIDPFDWTAEDRLEFAMDEGASPVDEVMGAVSYDKDIYCSEDSPVLDVCTAKMFLDGGCSSPSCPRWK